MDGPAPHHTYDRIADHFAATRPQPWDEVERFVTRRFDDTRLAVDVGCGNGRHAELLAERADRVVAVDASRGMCRVARKRLADGVHLARADGVHLPFPDDTTDIALSIATLHHLRPRLRRVAALDELARILAPGGLALVSVWSVTHDRFDSTAGFDTTVDWTLPDGETIPRYYHVYSMNGFRDELRDSACTVIETFESAGNCYAVLGP